MKKFYVSLISFLITLLGFTYVCYADAAPPIEDFSSGNDPLPILIGASIGVVIIVVASCILIKWLNKCQ